MRKTITGFTIVELLIVIVVIAILAAIGLVAYTGVQNRTYDNIVKQDLRNIAQKLELYRTTSTNDQYPAGTSQLTAAEVTATRDAYGGHYELTGRLFNLVYCRPSSGVNNDYAFVGRSKSDAIFQFTKSGGAAAFAGNWNGGSSDICAGTGIVNGGATRDWFYHEGGCGRHLCGEE